MPEQNEDNAQTKRAKMPTRVAMMTGSIILAASLCLLIALVWGGGWKANDTPVVLAATGILLGLFTITLAPLFLRSPLAEAEKQAALEKSLALRIFQMLEKLEASNTDSRPDSIREAASVYKETTGEAKPSVTDAALDRRVSLGSELLSTITHIRGRLEDEIDHLRSRANQALYAGVSTSAAGVAGLLLLMISYGELDREQDSLRYLLGLVPRLGLIGIAEALSFFFLRIYRDSLDLSRYYHNEMTTATMRLSAARAALVGDPESRSTILEVLARTDRNARILAGETTEDLERLKATLKAEQKASTTVERWMTKLVSSIGRQPSE